MNEQTIAQQADVNPFKGISYTDERAIEKWNYAVNVEMANGITWIPPFVSDFWSKRRVKPKPNKCVCEHCGNKHNLKGK